MENLLLTNYNKVQTKINQAIAQSKFQQKVELIAVSKTFNIDLIKELYTYGQHNFGENYAQELYTKASQLSNLKIVWHFIGAIQSNKIDYIAQKASWVHGLEKAKHTTLLNNNRPLNLPKLNILIEINISGEKNKRGINNIDELLELANIVNTQDNLVLRGLMGIASHSDNMKVIQNQFHQLKTLLEQLKLKGFLVDILSMGMSNDFEPAILCGSNMVRIGRLIFGTRNYSMNRV
ncbi:MAG: YggS family pyridoxal phosphate-dependent enzyme [Coxiellaceae bacterium]|jgi:pyridoxal phosphate enzyme (YggS family)|nr:YggS family pyridoxal phosphate-dependent enzyme [Coxiellaceae bacterium]